jgi:hypothetical protein
MKSPKLRVIPVSNKLVNFIMRLGADKRWSPIVHDKKNNTGGEDVSLKSSVFTLLHFWRLVALSSHSGIKLVILVVALAES